MPVKSHKMQPEAMHSSKHSDFERDFEGKTSMVESAFDGEKTCAKVLSKEKEITRAVISSAQLPQCTFEQ